jgi:hypothetical protein
MFYKNTGKVLRTRKIIPCDIIWFNNEQQYTYISLQVINKYIYISLQVYGVFFIICHLKIFITSLLLKATVRNVDRSFYTLWKIICCRWQLCNYIQRIRKCLSKLFTLLVVLVFGWKEVSSKVFCSSCTSNAVLHFLRDVFEECPAELLSCAI